MAGENISRVEGPSINSTRKKRKSHLLCSALAAEKRLTCQIMGRVARESRSKEKSSRPELCCHVKIVSCRQQFFERDNRVRQGAEPTALREASRRDLPKALGPRPRLES